jgi:hypothetical protein
MQEHLYIEKTQTQLKNWFNSKQRSGNNDFLDFEEFYEWYSCEDKICFYCGIKEPECQEIVLKGKLKSKRFPKDGIIGRGTSRGVWLEIDKVNPYSTYRKSNVVLACYFCNNDKSDIFNGKDYKDFMQNRLSFLKTFLTILLLVILNSCEIMDSKTLSELDARKIVEEEVAKSSSEILEVLEFTKTDGVKQNAFGQDFYLMNFHIKLKFQKNGNTYKIMGKDTYSYYSDEWLEKRLKLNYENRTAFRHYDKNEIIEFDTKNLFDKTENGWNY